MRMRVSWKNLVLIGGWIFVMSSCGTKKANTKLVSSASQPATVNPTDAGKSDPTTGIVTLTYIESPFESISIQPTTLDKSDSFMVTFEHTKKPEQVLADETGMATHYVKESDTSHLFINYHLNNSLLNFKNSNVQNNIYEIAVSTNEEFAALKSLLLNNQLLTKALVSITTVTTTSGQPESIPYNKVTFLKLNDEKIANLNYADVTSKFSDPATATVNLFELGDVSIFITKDIDEAVTFTPGSDGYRGFVSYLTPVKR